MGEVITTVRGEEIAFGIVNAAKDDGMLSFERIENAVGVFLVVKGK